MIRKFDDNRHSALYCPHCGNHVANAEEIRKLTYSYVIECERCGFEASNLSFSFQPLKKEYK